MLAAEKNYVEIDMIYWERVSILRFEVGCDLIFQFEKYDILMNNVSYSKSKRKILS